MKWTRVLLLLVAVVAFQFGAASLASAKQGPGKPGGPQPGKPGGQVVITGEVVSVSDDGTLLQIDRGKVDEDPDDDVSVLLTETTKYVPEGTTPAAGDHVKVMAQKPQAAGDPFVAVSVAIVTDRDGSGGKKPLRKVAIRGTVVGPLPDDRSGEWDLELAVKGHDNVIVVVTPDTETEGEVAAEAVVVVHAQAEIAADGSERLVALHVKVVEEKHARPGPAKGAVHFEGTVTSIDVDNGTWTVTEEDGNEVTFAVTDKTVILGLPAGDDPVGKNVDGYAGHADDGSLVARFIKFEKS